MKTQSVKQVLKTCGEKLNSLLIKEKTGKNEASRS